jgi:exodeoxyribonuclease VII large subunit
MPKEPELARVSTNSASKILTVSALNASVRDLLEHRYPLLWVRGEISNFMLARSGHAYFSLKDEQAQVRCVMFRHRSQYLDWTPRDGLTVEAQVLVSLYEPRGDFQLNVETMRRAGVGALFEAFVRLRDKLDQEGLFDPQHKRPLPAFPRRIGVVTSLDAAALRDVLTTLARRNPAIDVVIYPSPVQGEGAAEKLAAAIERAGKRRECDVLILARGGGSLEDLWAFNDERLARVIRTCPVPVVTGIGHETDFTIAEFVADQRAPTPTAAAELVSPSRAALLDRVGACTERLRRSIVRDIETRMQSLDQLQRRLVHPGRRVQSQLDTLAHLRQRLSHATRHAMELEQWQLVQRLQRLQACTPNLREFASKVQALLAGARAAAATVLERAVSRQARLAESLAHLNPAAVLERGYSIVSHADGKIVRDSTSLTLGEPLSLRFARGSASACVDSKDDTK